MFHSARKQAFLKALTKMYKARPYKQEGLENSYSVTEK